MAESDRFSAAREKRERLVGGWGYGDVTCRMVDAFVLARQVLREEIISSGVKLAVKDSLSLAVKVPDWADKASIKVIQNEKPRSTKWAKSFMTLPLLHKDDRVVV